MYIAPELSHYYATGMSTDRSAATALIMPCSGKETYSPATITTGMGVALPMPPVPPAADMPVHEEALPLYREIHAYATSV